MCQLSQAVVFVNLLHLLQDSLSQVLPVQFQHRDDFQRHEFWSFRLLQKLQHFVEVLGLEQVVHDQSVHDLVLLEFSQIAVDQGDALFDKILINFVLGKILDDHGEGLHVGLLGRVRLQNLLQHLL